MSCAACSMYSGGHLRHTFLFHKNWLYPLKTKGVFGKAVIGLQAEARALHEAGMGRYKLFKERLLQANATLVGLGTGLGWTFCGDEVALEFGTGGLAGLAYMWLLQNGVDRIGLSTSSSKVAQFFFPS